MVLEIIILICVIGVFIIVLRKIPRVIKNIRSREDVFKIEKKPLDEAPSKILGTCRGKEELKLSFTSILEKADQLFAKKNFREAEELYIQAASEDPRNPKIYNRLGAIYLEQKNYKDAKDAFSETLKYQDKPDKMALRYYNYALVCKELKEYRNTAEALEKAIELDKKNKKYHKLLDEINKKLS